MKKKASNKRPQRQSVIRRQVIQATELSSDLRIVLVEQEPLRKKAGKDARKHMEKAAALEGELSEYERTILPAFNRWEEEHLGKLLAEEKSLDAKIAQLDYMIETAYREAWMSGISPGAAFRELEKERKEDEEIQRAWRERERAEAERVNGGEEARRTGISEDDYQNEDEGSSQRADPDAGFSEEDRVFRIYVRVTYGINPDFMPKKEFRRACEEFHRMRARQTGGSSFASKGGRSKDSSIRIKELYRVLVRRLHPDLNRSGPDAFRNRLWAELQEAYAGGDHERMEVLIVMTEIHTGEDATQATLHHIREVALAMERKVREISGLLRKARKTPAWEFWKSDDRNLLALQSRAVRENNIRELRADLAKLEKQIEKLNSMKRSSPKKNRKSGDSFEDLIGNLFSQF